MNTLSKFLFPTLVLLLFLTSCEQDKLAETAPSTPALVTPSSTDGDIIEGQYIITIKKQAIKPAWDYVPAGKEFSSRDEQGTFLDAKALIVENELKNLLTELAINPEQAIAYYTMVNAGLNIKLSQEEFERVSRNEKVAAIEYDRQISLDYQVDAVNPGSARAQTVPCGIVRHGGFTNNPRYKWVWILDTGIDLDHPDLNVVRSASRTFVGGTPDDCNGHGTHVAGTIGARDNNFGVVGVAAGAPLVSVKVLPCTGSGTFGQLMSGFNYINSRATSGDVVNVSLGGQWANCGNQPALDPIRNLGNRGIRVVMAAGNNSIHAKDFYPACLNGSNIFTVASMSCNSSWASYSNYGNTNNGAPIDWIATGSQVYSTYKNGGYATLSGTSMAAPHVAGIIQARSGSYPIQLGTVTNRGYGYKVAGR